MSKITSSNTPRRRANNSSTASGKRKRSSRKSLIASNLKSWKLINANVGASFSKRKNFKCSINWNILNFKIMTLSKVL